MNPQTLAQRLGITAPCSVLLWKLRRLRREFPVADAGDLESWLVELAHSRGFHAIQRRTEALSFPITLEQLCNEELAVALLHPSLRDEPQLMRPAAQIISRGVVDAAKLTAIAEQASASRILANLAMQAMKAAPAHAVWNSVSVALENAAPLRENVIHWTRLAEPVMKPRGPHNGEWRLIA